MLNDSSSLMDRKKRTKPQPQLPTLVTVVPAGDQRKACNTPVGCSTHWLSILVPGHCCSPDSSRGKLRRFRCQQMLHDRVGAMSLLRDCLDPSRRFQRFAAKDDSVLRSSRGYHFLQCI